MKKNIITLLLLLSLLACNSNPEKNKDLKSITDKLINIDPTKSSTTKLSKIFSSLSYVLLESNDYLIGVIEKVIVFNNRVFIMDNNNNIFIYNRFGNFINCINNHGKGPKEFEIIYDFNIDTYNKQIKFSAVLLNKMLSFDFDGNFVSEYRIPKIIYRSKMLIEKDYNIIWTNNSSNKESDFKINDDIIFVTKSWDYISSFLPIKSWEQNFKFEVHSAFSIYKGKVTFQKPLNDTIYFINPDSITPRFIVDFGKYKIPTKYFNDLSGKTSYEKMQTQKRFLTKITNEDIAYFIRNYLEDKHSVFFMFSFKKKQINTFYSKSTGNIIISKTLVNDIDKVLYSPPIAATDSEFVSIIEPADLIEHYKKIKNKYPANELKTIKQLVDSITEFDNPILVFAKTKPF